LVEEKGASLNLKYIYTAVTCLLAVTLFMAIEPRAYAYVDPGSSLLLFQSISAMVTGALFYFRRRLKSLVVRSDRTEAKSGEERD
jgi:hypothetical protein